VNWTSVVTIPTTTTITIAGCIMCREFIFKKKAHTGKKLFTHFSRVDQLDANDTSTKGDIEIEN
jgi:hypothetical protein